MLLDVNMPGISGVELVPQIMELEPTIAILMLTAVNDATSAALCMQRGAFDYLIKPIDLGHLSRAIHHALQRRHTSWKASRSINGSRKRYGPGSRAEAGAGQSGADLGGHAGGPGERAGGQGPLPPGSLGPGRGPLGDGCR